MSSELNLVSSAREYQEANAAYFESNQGRAEIEAKTAFKKAYLGCIASDQEKMNALTGLARETISKCQRSYVSKHEKGILVVQDKNVSVDDFVQAATAYQTTLLEASVLPEFSEEVRTVGVFRENVVKELKTSTGIALREVLEANGITSARVLSRPEYWEKKYS